MSYPTDAEIEAVGRAVFFTQHIIMHDHEECWRERKREQGDLWNEIAVSAIKALDDVRKPDANPSE